MLMLNINIRKPSSMTKYLFQDLHGKYLPCLSALDLPNLKNLRKYISWYSLVIVKPK